MATIGDAKQVKTGRDLAAWLGLTPRNTSGGGREPLGRITRKGDRYIRKRLIVGMTSRAPMAELHPEKVGSLDRRNHRQQTVPAGNNRHGKQGGAGHLGDTDKRGKLPAAGRLTGKPARDARRMT